MLNNLPLAEALQDPEALPTVNDCLNSIYIAVQNMHHELNINRSGRMGLGTPEARKSLRTHLDALTCALDEIDAWGNEIIDYAEKSA